MLKREIEHILRSEFNDLFIMLAKCHQTHKRDIHIKQN